MQLHRLQVLRYHDCAICGSCLSRMPLIEKASQSQNWCRCLKRTSESHVLREKKSMYQWSQCYCSCCHCRSRSGWCSLWITTRYKLQGSMNCSGISVRISKGIQARKNSFSNHHFLCRKTTEEIVTTIVNSETLGRLKIAKYYRFIFFMFDLPLFSSGMTRIRSRSCRRAHIQACTFSSQDHGRLSSVHISEHSSFCWRGHSQGHGRLPHRAQIPCTRTKTYTGVELLGL